MAEEDFYFGLLRITIAQLLRSHGFDRCSNKAVDIVSDIYVRYLQLIVRTMGKLATAREESLEDVTIQDIAQALVEVKLIRPAAKLDPYDFSPANTAGIENFEKWFLSPAPDRAREVARPSKEFIQERLNEKKAEMAATSYKSLLAKATEDAQPQEEVTEEEDWIRFTLKGQIEGKDSRFKGSVLVDYLPQAKPEAANGNGSKARRQLRPSSHEFLVIGNTPENLIDHLPYIKESDSESEPDEYIEELNEDPRSVTADFGEDMDAE